MQHKVYFKKTISGMVLMIEDRKPNGGFGFDNFWRKATEAECQRFRAETLQLDERKSTFERLKTELPELFI